MSEKKTLSIVIPCYNEEATLKSCVERVLSIVSEELCLEIVIVDDCSTDKSLFIAQQLALEHSEISVFQHSKNQGKGAALRTGFQKVTGDYVAVQDADLEYEPEDLKRLLVPLVEGNADVVLGSRFLSTGAHRVFYFWHYMGNRFLTLLSNMLTDLNLTDMETCYKVFRREVIQNITIKENRFGFEPEIVAEIAKKRLRIYEMGINYYGRTYAEGKKIGVSDGFRALYCILRYNAYKAPMVLQFFIYMFIGGVTALVNSIVFLGLFYSGVSLNVAVPFAFFVSAAINYYLCIRLLFRHTIRWNATVELLMLFLVVFSVGWFDWWLTRSLVEFGLIPGLAKIFVYGIGLVPSYLGLRIFVFPEPATGPWLK